MPSTSTSTSSAVRYVERDSKTTGSSAQTAWNGDMKAVPVVEGVAAAKFDVCAILRSTLRTLDAQVSNSEHFTNFLQRITTTSVTFPPNKWIKLGIYFKVIHYIC
jgi:uncharacterized protein involved in propanediol utilization